MKSCRAFTMIEALLVAGLIGLFASIVIPGLSNAALPIAAPVEAAIEADLRLARTEALARARAVEFVVGDGGTRWWIADASDPSTPVSNTLREFGRGTLHAMSGATIEVTNPFEVDPQQSNLHGSVIARFDALGTRDEGVATITLRDKNGAAAGHWKLPAGRTRLASITGK